MTSSAPPPERAFFGSPYAWLALAIGLLVVPISGYMLESDMSWTEVHPAINAMLNGTCAIFLLVGRPAIKRGNRALHRQCMLSAFAASSLFLASYLARYAISGTHHYPGHGWDKTLYIAILSSHMLLAIVLLPLVFRTLYLGLKGKDSIHRRWARYAYPIWLYVSVTGVVVYFMLYHFAG